MSSSRIDIPLVLCLALAALGFCLSVAWERNVEPVDPVSPFGRSPEEVAAGPRAEHAALAPHPRDYLPAGELRRSWSALHLIDPASTPPGLHFIVRADGGYDWSLDWMKQRRIPGFGDRIVVSYREGAGSRAGLADIRAALEKGGILSGIAAVIEEKR